MITYLDFINEAKKTEMLIGKHVYFNGTFRNIIGDIKNKFGIIREINVVNRKKLYSIELIGFQVYTKTPFVRTNTIKITDTQLKNITVLDDGAYEQIKSGKLKLLQYTYFLKMCIGNLNIKVPPVSFMDITYVDVDPEKDDMVTYMPSNKIDVGEYNDLYNNRYRQSMKVSKFLRKLDPTINDKDMEKLVIDFKATYITFVKNAGNVILVKGENIRHWYDQGNYSRASSSYTDSDLWNSCMRQKSDQRRFDIYCDHTDRIAMAIILDKNQKLAARALVWKLSKPDGDVYMDRIYSIDYKFESILKNFAKENGWRTYYDRQIIMHVNLNRDYGTDTSNPYMDTFKYVKLKDGKYSLSNDMSGWIHVYNDH